MIEGKIDVRTVFMHPLTGSDKMAAKIVVLESKEVGPLAVCRVQSVFILSPRMLEIE